MNDGVGFGEESGGDCSFVEKERDGLAAKGDCWGDSAGV